MNATVAMKKSMDYTDETVVGLGGLKGSPCTVKSEVETTQGGKLGKLITFAWVGTDGTEQTKTVFIAYGEDATINGLTDVTLAAGDNIRIETDENENKITISATVDLKPAYVHEQVIQSDTWNVQHNLGKRCPNIVAIDMDGNRVFGQTDYFSDNLTIITFSTPLSGYAYLS